MKILYSIALTTIFVSLPVHSSLITAKNGRINCNGLICPEGSTSCFVSDKTFGDLSKYRSIRICADDNGEQTDSKTDELDNPYPGTIIDNITQYGGNRKLTEEEKKQLQEQLDKITEETGKIVKDAVDSAKETVDYWNNWASDYTANMMNRFPPGFPFNK